MFVAPRLRSIAEMLFLLLLGFSAGTAVIMFIADSAMAATQIVPGPGEPVSVPDGPASQWVPLYLLALGAVAPLVGYLLNHFAPWASEQVKGVVQAVLAAGVAVLYQAVTPGDLGLNDQTLLAVATAMFGSLVGHLGWKQASINTMLGAGSNANGEPPRSIELVGPSKPRRTRSRRRASD